MVINGNSLIKSNISKVLLKMLHLKISAILVNEPTFDLASKDINTTAALTKQNILLRNFNLFFAIWICSLLS